MICLGGLFVSTHITLEDKNTVVVNTPVGNGKSYAIIQTIKRFYDAEEDYLIFVAAPFVSSNYPKLQCRATSPRDETICRL